MAPPPAPQLRRTSAADVFAYHQSHMPALADAGPSRLSSASLDAVATRHALQAARHASALSRPSETRTPPTATHTSRRQSLFVEIPSRPRKTRLPATGLPTPPPSAASDTPPSLPPVSNSLPPLSASIAPPRAPPVPVAASSSPTRSSQSSTSQTVGPPLKRKRSRRPSQVAGSAAAARQAGPAVPALAPPALRAPVSEIDVIMYHHRYPHAAPLPAAQAASGSRLTPAVVPPRRAQRTRKRQPRASTTSADALSEQEVVGLVTPGPSSAARPPAAPPPLGAELLALCQEAIMAAAAAQARVGGHTGEAIRPESAAPVLDDFVPTLTTPPIATPEMSFDQSTATSSRHSPVAPRPDDGTASPAMDASVRRLALALEAGDAAQLVAAARDIISASPSRSRQVEPAAAIHTTQATAAHPSPLPQPDQCSSPAALMSDFSFLVPSSPVAQAGAVVSPPGATGEWWEHGVQDELDLLADGRADAAGRADGAGLPARVVPSFRVPSWRALGRS